MRTYGVGTGRVSLRHGTGDVPLFYDIFSQRHYAPPAEVMRALRGGGAVSVGDLGANIGLFSAFIASELPVDTVVAYEPDRANLHLLRLNLDAALAARHRVVDACAGASDGEVAFKSGDFGRSRAVAVGSTDAGVSVLPRIDVLPDLAVADLVKIDIEGGEWDILTDTRFDDLSARALVMEYHPWQCPGSDPRATAEDLLARRGFTVRTAREHVPGFGEIWAWR